MFDHLTHVDPEIWPGIATVPSGKIRVHKAAQAEARFAQICAKAGLSLEGSDPDIEILHDAFFARISDSGWLGIAESYMAEEWDAKDLASVLYALLSAEYKPKVGNLFSSFHKKIVTGIPGDLPDSLIELSGGQYTGIFSTGISTTVREALPSYSPRAGKKGEPSQHYVDITTITDPAEVEREDLAGAQMNAIDSLLSMAHIISGSDVLEWPLSGAALMESIHDRGAVVDSLTTDAERARAIGLRASHDANIHVIDSPIPPRSQWRGRYDALISLDLLEIVGARGAIPYIQTIERLMGNNASAVIQTVVRSPKMGSIHKEALSAIQAYIWPTLYYLSLEEVHKLVDRNTHLRIVSEKHLGGHYPTSLRLKREIFHSHLPQAAAAGYDRVYRRLWSYHFALLEALAKLGMIEMVHLELHGRKAYRL